jgi:hypothetical protein
MALLLGQSIDFCSLIGAVMALLPGQSLDWLTVLLLPVLSCDCCASFCTDGSMSIVTLFS